MVVVVLALGACTLAMETKGFLSEAEERMCHGRRGHITGGPRAVDEGALRHSMVHVTLPA